jgi:hypothetical protein
MTSQRGHWYRARDFAGQCAPYCQRSNILQKTVCILRAKEPHRRLQIPSCGTLAVSCTCNITVIKILQFPQCIVAEDEQRHRATTENKYVPMTCTQKWVQSNAFCKENHGKCLCYHKSVVAVDFRDRRDTENAECPGGGRARLRQNVLCRAKVSSFWTVTPALKEPLEGQ